MSCNATSNGAGVVGDLSSSAMDGLRDYLAKLEASGQTPSIIGKVGGVANSLKSAAEVLTEFSKGNHHLAHVNVGGVLGGAGAATAMGVVVLAAGWAAPVAIVVVGVASFQGAELGKKLTDFILDPTLEPSYYEETLLNREQRLRDRGINPETDLGVQNLRRGLEKSRQRAGIPSPSDCPIEDIKKKTQTASTIPSPIVLDLDGDGVETITVANGASFDHAADGFAERTGWAGGDDGLLVRDINDNGTIDSGRELFGSETLLVNGSKAANGFEALGSLDTNSDGVIDAADAVFSELRVWKDANGNGRTDAGELLSLAEADVQSINVNYSNSSFVDAQGNAHRQVGSYTNTDGQTRTATDVWVLRQAANGPAWRQRA